ncbi:MAG: FG-GAP repeat protein [Alphaproteobacteria bacterium]|nr:FG-GAP repeat protein [Alphaproteobacteria bacterium]
MRAMLLVALMVGCTDSEDFDGDGFTPHMGDCDDGDAAIFPGAEERCDGVDADCDGSVDESPVDGQTWYADWDGDGYGLDGTEWVACAQIGGYAAEGGDCDNTDAAIHPGAAEACDAVDQDCDSAVDEGFEGWRLDRDGDGFGDPDAPGCDVNDASDCDDADPGVSPAGVEVCDSGDDDCDGFVDEGFEGWRVDQDGDGFGDPATLGCDVEDTSDCDDADPSRYPGAAEICADGVVNDCDGDAATALDQCFLSGTVSMADADLRFEGEATGDYVGATLTGLGDVDGDGLADLMVSAMFEQSGGRSAGAVYLLTGANVQQLAAGTHTLAVADAKFTGEDRDAEAGYASAGVPDLDGDGLPEALVGACGYNGGLRYQGAAYLLESGGALGSASGQVSLGSADLVLEGEGEGHSAGFALAGLAATDAADPDVLVVGAPYEGGSTAGAVYVLRSDGALATARANGAHQMDLGQAELKLTASAARDNLFLLSTAGDLDGDGREELLASSPDAGTNQPGVVWVVTGDDLFGSTTGVMRSSDIGIPIVGDYDFAQAGTALGHLDDVDQDGAPEVLVTAVSAYGRLGAVYVFEAGAILGASGSVPLSDAVLRIEGDANNQLVGYSLSDAGDPDGDGLPDLLVGVPYASNGPQTEGVVGLLLGGGALSGASGTLAFTDADVRFEGDLSHDYTGWSVAGVGDVDGDHYGDLLIGASNYRNSAGYTVGVASLVYGGGL